MAILPALYAFVRPGQEVILAKATALAIADGATGFNTPFPGTWPGIAVAAGDILKRGNIEEIVINGVSTHAGSVHMVAFVPGGTVIAGTIGTVAMVADTFAGTVFVLNGLVDAIRFQFINAAGAIGTVTAEVRGRTRA